MSADSTTQSSSSAALLAFAWVAVLVPLLWGTVVTIEKALALFR
jgi:hypothetical protein